MGLIKSTVGDAVLTSLWVFSVSTLGTLTAISAAALGLQAKSSSGLLLMTALATVLMLIFSVVSSLLGGASFNPATTVALYAAGLKPGVSLLSFAVRFPVQAAAGAAGARAISQVMPVQYRHMLRGPSLKVDLHTGAIAEGALTFSICLVALMIFTKGPKNLLIKVWLLATATVGLVVIGAGFTGPAMNPANAFGWAYMNNWHNTWDQFYVYWICPFIGAALAGRVYRFLFPVQKKPKQKAA
ncbi:aquaporin SIP1-1-like [Punica granatum]|uniref:Uncharacterized protein n=2 Tax=Punica granatum TaxID=22663 RepID=A0A218X3J4_PUNGR|nr:aquaporin SIP1-1-like [Punica granatum]OWM79815.1 hypothetical protein CDL15_Pgr023227 [Punica granatum]PKI41962.1 hypothetical protein CRG98_037645 [Punica granatum]